MKLLILTLSLLITSLQQDTHDTASANGHVLILNKSSNSAWQIDASTGQKVQEYATGVAPHEVALSPNKNRAIITNYGDQHPGNSLTIVDLQNKRVKKTISLGKFTRPHGVQWFSDNRRAIVTAEEQQAIIVIDIDNGKILKSIKTDQKVSHMVALGQNESTAYITNLGSGSVSVINLETEEVTTTLPTGDGTEGVAVLPKQNEIWITNRSANTVSVVDHTTNKIIDSSPSSNFPIRAEVSPHQQWVAVSNAKSSEVSIFDAATRDQVQKISTAEKGKNAMPIGLTFSDDNRFLFVANSQQNNISVIDTNNWKLINTFKTDQTPDGIAYIPFQE